MFLREVAAFRDTIYAVEVDEDARFREFLQIINKFVKSGSSYEVNIDCRARNEVMRYGEEAKFKELDAVSDGFQLSVPLNRRHHKRPVCSICFWDLPYNHAVAATLFTRSQARNSFRSVFGSDILL